MLLVAKTSGLSTVVLEDEENGCWLSFQDEDTAERVRRGQLAAVPASYQWQIADLHLWIGDAAVVQLASVPAQPDRIKVTLSDDYQHRQIIVGCRDDAPMTARAWLASAIGLRLPG